MNVKKVITNLVTINLALKIHMKKTVLNLSTIAGLELLLVANAKKGIL